MKHGALHVFSLMLIMSLLVIGCAMDPQSIETVLQAAATQTAAVETAREQLQDRTWVLGSINGAPPIATTDITLEFATLRYGERRDSASGRTGCADNGYGAPYELLSGQRLDIIEPFETEEEGCIAPLAEEQEKYLTLLGEATTYAVVGNRLTLTTDAGETLVFTARR